MATIQRIKARDTVLPLPPPPSLAKLMKAGVVTKTDAEAFDLAVKRWWEAVQVALRSMDKGKP